MCIDFIDLNAAYAKDLWPLLNIKRLINGSSSYRALSFMDAYSWYNQIQIDPLDSPQTSFMLNHDNYYYNVMPFGLKNDDATYQHLMDAIFAHQIRRNLEFYMNDMIVKTIERHNHVEDLENVI